MNPQEIHNIINTNYHHPNFGKLLYHRDRKNQSILHYSLQINNYDSLAWEPINADKQKDTGQINIWHINWEYFHPAKWIQYLPKEKISHAIHISADKFHQNWQYDFFRFNCEHWARLVSTGDCRCFQIHEFKKLETIPIAGLAIVGVASFVTGAWEHNNYAQDVIDKAD